MTSTSSSCARREFWAGRDEWEMDSHASTAKDLTWLFMPWRAIVPVSFVPTSPQAQSSTKKTALNLSAVLTVNFGSVYFASSGACDGPGYQILVNMVHFKWILLTDLLFKSLWCNTQESVQTTSVEENFVSLVSFFTVQLRL